MLRLYLPVTQIINNQISVTGEKAHYLVSVLRCQKGDDLLILDGEGNCIKTSIMRSNRKEVVAEIKERSPCNLESSINIILVQGLLKGEKMDMVIQKATELGVKEIMPVITMRSQMRETRKMARWRKIAEEASRQSGRGIAPIVHEPIAFKNIFAQTSTNHPSPSTLAKGRNRGAGFIFYEEGGMKLSEAFSSFIPHPSSFVIIIGPEGGFEKEEVSLAKEKGILVVSFGRRILRAETAAISAVTLVQFLLGDMG
jgi:16S rRNA (uracil1498-N3)-methyltransferase